MKFILMWLVCASLYHLSVDALRCNDCHYDTSQNRTVCTVTIQNCTALELFCGTITTERHDGSKTFKRGCVPNEVCERDYCDKIFIQELGRKLCDITCCEEDLCNRDGYVPPVKSGYVSQVHWCSEYGLFLLAAAWMWLS